MPTSENFIILAETTTETIVFLYVQPILSEQFFQICKVVFFFLTIIKLELIDKKKQEQEHVDLTW